MKCAVHTDVDATGYCRNCGKPLCPQCAREVRGALYCEQCLASMMAPPQGTAAQFATTPVTPIAPPGYVYAPAIAQHGPNPGTACALGFIPGLGAVYNGEYIKGLIHVIIFGGIIAILSSNSTPEGLQALLGVFLGVFCCYMPIEAYRTARAKRLGVPVTGFFGETAPPVTAEGVPAGGAPTATRNYTGALILIVVGILCLLATTGVLDSRWIGNLWPLILVAVGVALLVKRRATS
ncbi:MAG TPA: B-box zinc finger protein [Candidatus Acidoferrales bacterium]|nr:B-box zinc finger protein [Candidatus Acidoferrales bacterium]